MVAPNQTLTITLEERGLSAGQAATFFSFSIFPWLIKPAYGLLSDCVPLCGRRRKSYLLLTSALAAGAGLAMGLATPHSYWWLAGLITVMGLGLAFTDVLVDALMVESGKPRGLTGAFQAVQWAAIYTAAAVIVGELGGFLAERRSLHAAFVLAALFPLISFSMTLFVVHDPPARADRKAFRQTLAAVREAVGGRDLWIVAGFIGSLAAVAGAIIYAPLSRRVPLKRLINVSIGAGMAGLLAYLLYRGPWSAVVIDIVFGCVLQRREPELAGGGRLPLRLAGLRSPGAALGGLHRGGVVPGPAGQDRPHRGQGEGGPSSPATLRPT